MVIRGYIGWVILKAITRIISFWVFAPRSPNIGNLVQLIQGEHPQNLVGIVVHGVADFLAENLQHL